MEKPKDFYVILGVPRNASPTTIKKAYRRLARKLHPDKSASASADDFRELQAAYETLIDAERRRHYDQSLGGKERSLFRQSGWSLLRTPGVTDLRRPVRRGTVSGEILLRPDEASSGGVLPLGIPLSSSCPECHGTGGGVLNCPSCWGEGMVERRLPVSLRIPGGVRDGTVFQIDVDDPSVVSVFLTIHIRAL